MDVKIQLIRFKEINFRNLMLKERVAVKNLPGTVYIGVRVNNMLVGVAAYHINGNSIRYKTDFMLPNYRGLGLYKKLFQHRERLVIDHAHNSMQSVIVTAFCTPMSLPVYLKNRFIAESEKNGITFVRKTIII
jgi:hypothetical protein